ncbi:MAG: GTP 3',8-cyclase MoaA [Chloroflexi bacterium]|nr:GTP 3',8-cyclase MoaA [Chloroflexota bacterium]MCY3938760.1 GTP 3',8-cyclase MoaA [Chloroflexota bacterium]
MAQPALNGARAVTDTLGRPIRDLRVSLTDRCNFRCDYCMPAEIFGEHYEFLHRREILSFEEIERLVRIFVGFGVKKVRLTGGEPLLRKDVPVLVEMLSRIDGIDDLTLTTNGYLLDRLAAPLAKAGLQRVTVSLDSPDDGIFRQMNGRDYGVEPVLKGIESAAAAGLSPIKINCVVIRGVNDHTIVDLARRFKRSGHILRFIEYMDVGNRNNWNLSQVVTAREICERIDSEFPLEPLNPNYRGEVANRFAYADGSGEIGIVASVSQPFCGDCSRARLSTDGRLVTCLFAGGGESLRDLMRAGCSDAEMERAIGRIWSARTDRYSEERSENTDLDGYARSDRKIEMYQIGG